MLLLPFEHNASIPKRYAQRNSIVNRDKADSKLRQKHTMHETNRSFKEFREFHNDIRHHSPKI